MNGFAPEPERRVPVLGKRIEYLEGRDRDMGFVLERYDPEIHDKEVVADLIFKSDEEMNSLVYGKNATKVIARLLNLGDNYFSPDYMQCAIHDGQVVGVIVGFPVREKKQVDKISGQSFARAMGFLKLLAKMPLYMKMSKIVAGEMDDDGYYIHTISVSPAYRGRGVGSKMIEAIGREHDQLYLHVNRKNDRAMNFYRRGGFEEKFKGTVNYKGRELSESLMEKK